MVPLLEGMSALEFQAWAAYRRARGLHTRMGAEMTAIHAWRYAAVNRGKDAPMPEVGDFLPAARPLDVPSDAGSRYTAEERRTMATLMRGV